MTDKNDNLTFEIDGEPHIESEYSDDWQTTMTIELEREDGETGDVWVCAGVPDYQRGTSEAARTQNGYMDVWTYGDAEDYWCPASFRIAGLTDYSTVVDNVITAVRDVALRTHKARVA